MPGGTHLWVRAYERPQQETRECSGLRDYPQRDGPEDNRMLLVSEVFISLQGETTFTGWPSTFIRLGGCNLRCRWCDTLHALSGGDAWERERLLQEAARGPRLVTITGGEPLCQPETPDLVRDLLDAGHTVVVETNGSLPIDALDPAAHRIVDLKPPSSGETDQICWPNLDLLTAGDEVKIVIADEADFAWAREHLAADPRLRAVTVNLSPAHGRMAPDALAEKILASGLQVRLNFQLHKLLWPTVERGR